MLCTAPATSAVSQAPQGSGAITVALVALAGAALCFVGNELVKFLLPKNELSPPQLSWCADAESWRDSVVNAARQAREANQALMKRQAELDALEACSNMCRNRWEVAVELVEQSKQAVITSRCAFLSTYSSFKTHTRSPPPNVSRELLHRVAG